MTELQKELAAVLNKHCLENASSTPDFILASYLLDCLATYNKAVRARHDWTGATWEQLAEKKEEPRDVNR